MVTDAVAPGEERPRRAIRIIWPPQPSRAGRALDRDATLGEKIEGVVGAARQPPELET